MACLEVKLMSSKLNKHLSLEDRKTIEKALDNGASRTAIAQILGKDKSTICKEVKLRRYVYSNPYIKGTIRDCIHLEECNLKVCKSPCANYQMVRCSRRDRKVGVCNGCSSFTKCNKTRYLYKAEKAHQEYRTNLVDAREGIDLTSSQAKELGDFLKPLINHGQSPYTIVTNHPELGICKKTLYNYITSGVFTQSGLYDIDLRIKTKRKPIPSKVKSKPRESRAYLKGRTYKDFQEYLAIHRGASVVEMDTVYNDGSNGPFIQTFQIVDLNLMIGVYHQKKTADTMVLGMQKIRESLGNDFLKLFQITLTDRGSEFCHAEAFEETGTKMFYCDPMQSCQKPHVENNHRLLRYILPSNKNLTKLGLQSQEDLDLIFSHINSYVREELKGKSPIDIFSFYYSDTLYILEKLHIKKIDSDAIVLTPNLMKKK